MCYVQDITKQTEKAGLDVTQWRKAINVMTLVPKAANDMMNVGRLQGFDGVITAQGKLLHQGTLLCSDTWHKPGSSKQSGDTKMEERRVFLFEQIIIFSRETEKRKNNLSQPGYIYRSSLKVNNMTLKENVPGYDSLHLQLIDKTPGSELRILCLTSDEADKDMWIEQINIQLSMQTDLLAGK